jgi:hypothetical protein
VKNLNYLFFIVMLFSFLMMNSNTFAQAEPVMYFCDRYDDYDGEIGIKDRFYKGPITVMVKCDVALNLTDATIQYDRYNFRSGKFEYYKSFDFDVSSDMKYIFFAPTSGNSMEFDDAGFYRVFLLDPDGNTVASALIEIISY